MSSAPPSPIHPNGDEEVQELPQGTFDIDLNPNISDDNDSTASIPNQDTQLPVEAWQIQNNAPGVMPGHDIDNLTSSFDEAYGIIKSEFHSHDAISNIQQSKFINYIDDELLIIQRKFIKAQSGQITYELPSLNENLVTVLKLIWLSISPNNVNNVEYLLKILTDLEDYIELYKVINAASGIFQLVQFLDVRLSFLYDLKFLSSTQYVRALSVVSRLRMIIISKFIRTDDLVIELEISKLFEGILDRS